MSIIINEYINYVQIIRIVYKKDLTLMNTLNVNKKDIIFITL